MAIYPSKRTFNALTKNGGLVPVCKEIFLDFENPLTVFSKVKKFDYPFLLESVEGGEKWGRFSFIGFSPFAVFTFKDGDFKISLRKGVETGKAKTPLEPVKEFLKRYRVVRYEGLPRFLGGAVGYISYDCIRFFEKLKISSREILNLPDAMFLFTDRLIVYDNLRHTFLIVVLAEKGGYEDALKEIESIEKVIRKDKFERDEIYLDKASPLKTSSNFTRKRFEEIVRITKEYIFAGDVIQVVLSQRLKAYYSGDPFRIYRALRVINPSPYMFYLDLHDFQIIGSSPEILVRVEGREIEVKPIAGTRPRGKTRDEDMKLENELVNSEKERAEHIMLVDLGRNDVGRVSLPGSVKVTDLMVVERYSHVMHLVSSVKGILRDDVDMFSAFVSAFPAGTVTGAPKIRAMEIIDELENERRGIYAGALGYFDYSGNMDMAIAIRTLIKRGRDVYIQAGAGIVADSEPSAEYEETLSKARALLRAVEMAGKK